MSASNKQIDGQLQVILWSSHSLLFYSTVFTEKVYKVYVIFGKKFD